MRQWKNRGDWSHPLQHSWCWWVWGRLEWTFNSCSADFGFSGRTQLWCQRGVEIFDYLAPNAPEQRSSFEHFWWGLVQPSFWVFFAFQLADGDVSGIHSAERGPWWSQIQLERVAIEPIGSDAHGGPSGMFVHAPERKTRSASDTIRPRLVYQAQLQGRLEPILVRKLMVLSLLLLTCQMVKFWWRMQDVILMLCSQVDYRAKIWSCNFCFQRNAVRCFSVNAVNTLEHRSLQCTPTICR